MKKAFSGDLAFCSNFYPCMIYYEHYWFESVESAYQAAKTTDKEQYFKFAVMTPWQAKRAGKQLLLRPDWDNIKLKVMEKLLRQKFSKTLNPDCYNKLLATGNLYLEETNYWNDCYWGVCNGKGENHLGKLLMKIRKELQDAEQSIQNSSSIARSS